MTTLIDTFSGVDEPTVVGIRHVRDLAVALRSRAGEPSPETGPEAWATFPDALVRVSSHPVLSGHPERLCGFGMRRRDLWGLRHVAHILMLRRPGVSNRRSDYLEERRAYGSRRE